MVDFGGFNSADKTPPGRRQRCHTYWMFPRPAESSFYIHPHQHHFPETLLHSNMRTGRESFDDLCGPVGFVIHMLQMTGGCQGTKTFLA